jgi:hypothetical protein
MRRACPLRHAARLPVAAEPDGGIGGLAVAAASATLSNFFHPHDAAATDLVVYVIAVALVIVTNQAFADRRWFLRNGPVFIWACCLRPLIQAAQISHFGVMR